MVQDLSRLYQVNSAHVLKDIIAAVVNVEPKKHENLII